MFYDDPCGHLDGHNDEPQPDDTMSTPRDAGVEPDSRWLGRKCADPEVD
jgi:hypothetical protein